MFTTSLLFSTHHFSTLKLISCPKYSSLDWKPQIQNHKILHCHDNKKYNWPCPLFLTQTLLEAPKTLGASNMIRVTKSIFGYVNEVIFEPYLRGFPGGSDSKASTCNAGDLGLIPGLGRSPREENGNLLQYSCLENSVDGGVWWATVHVVANSQDKTERLHFHFKDCCGCLKNQLCDQRVGNLRPTPLTFRKGWGVRGQLYHQWTVVQSSYLCNKASIETQKMYSRQFVGWWICGDLRRVVHLKKAWKLWAVFPHYLATSIAFIWLFLNYILL